jgi:hypothetical protein
VGVMPGPQPAGPTDAELAKMSAIDRRTLQLRRA